MRIGLLIDGSSLGGWQANALAQLDPAVELRVYNCTNAPARLRQLWHWPYYLLNLISLRTDQTRRSALPGSLTVAEWVDFECLVDGGWQRLPEALIDRLAADMIEVIAKFGPVLLRGPGAQALSNPHPSLPPGRSPPVSRSPGGILRAAQRTENGRASRPGPIEPPRRRSGRG